MGKLDTGKYPGREDVKCNTILSSASEAMGKSDEVDYHESDKAKGSTIHPSAGGYVQVSEVKGKVGLV
jgi:hypothetical protein